MSGKEEMTIPKVGISCVVRNRLGVVLNVKEFSGAIEKQYLVTVSYKDSGFPDTEELLWNIEPGVSILPPAALPDADSPAMPLREMDALVRACRWNASRPYVLDEGMEAIGSYPVSAPFYGTIQPDDYQLVPLLKALRMPRVSMMIADDVGLGKTIEAGLIINELLIRRRVNRILILCPASLRIQWRDEMMDKFSLPFDVVDSNSTLRLKRDVGIDANPWRFHNRIIASYHYLKQALIFEQFQNALSTNDGTIQLPWDLLIVDEAHNLMPSPFGKDSDLCQMLRRLAPMFEHKIFLTATPHNGNTRCFSGLLEILDPARFRMTDELTPAEKTRVRQVVVRRMKSEINQRTNPPKFSHRNDPQPLDLDNSFSLDSNHELSLIFAVEDFKQKLRSIVSQDKRRRTAGFFAIEVLAKRLLSCPMTFLESWQRCKESLYRADQEAALEAEQELAGLSLTLNADVTDDKEAQVAEVTAASRVGAWLVNFADELAPQISDIDAAVKELGIDLSKGVTSQTPNSDARFDLLCKLIRSKLMVGDDWRTDERLVIFTEYKTTQDYLMCRLEKVFHDHENQRITVLYGGMEDTEREIIKRRFNDENDDVRILIATDAASEGLNLQETARYLLHFDCPWNPSRLEQRNGRLDRHGQARDVSIFYFTSTDDENMRFMARMVEKIHNVREDLGSCGKIFGNGIQERVVAGQKSSDSLLNDVDRALETARKESAIPGNIDNSVSLEELDHISQQLRVLAEELDLDDSSRHDLLQIALNGQCTPLDDEGCFKLTQPNMSGWRDTIDETIRYAVKGGRKSLPKLTFSVNPFLQDKNGRKVYRNRLDVRMLHLGHPLMQRAINVLGRRRYPGQEVVSRWTVREARLPVGVEAIFRVHLEEMAVNQLREAFHNWVRTMDFPVIKGQLQTALPHHSAFHNRQKGSLPEKKRIEEARNLYDDLFSDFRKLIIQEEKRCGEAILQKLTDDGKRRLEEERKNFQSREGELSSMIRERTIASKMEELRRLKQKMEQMEDQPLLFDDFQQEEQNRIQDDIDSVKRAIQDDQDHYDELRRQLQKERTRIVEELLPRRFALDGCVKLYPIAVEIILPKEGN